MQTLKERRTYQREWYRKNRGAKSSKKFDKAAYMKEYHAKRKAEKEEQIGKDKPLQNGALMEVINAYKTLYDSTNNGQVKADLNKTLANIIIETA